MNALLNVISSLMGMTSGFLLSTWYVPAALTIIGLVVMYLNNEWETTRQTAGELIGFSFFAAGVNLGAAEWSGFALVITTVLTAAASFLMFYHAMALMEPYERGWNGRPTPYRYRKGWGIQGLVLVNAIMVMLAIYPFIPAQVARAACCC